MKNQVQPMLLTVREASILLRLHRPKVYDLLRENILEGFKLGADWRIRRDSVEKLVGPIPLEFFETQRQLTRRGLEQEFTEMEAA